MHKKSLKAIISLLLIFSLLLSLTACGNSKVSNTMKDYSEGAYKVAESYINNEIEQDEAERKLRTFEENAEKYEKKIEEEYGSTSGSDYKYYMDGFVSFAIMDLRFAVSDDDYSKIKEKMKELKKYM